jgi:hypothetical protein
MKTKEQIEAKLNEFREQLKYGRGEQFGMDRDAECCLMNFEMALAWALDVASEEAFGLSEKVFGE